MCSCSSFVDLSHLTDNSGKYDEEEEKVVVYSERFRRRKLQVMLDEDRPKKKDSLYADDEPEKPAKNNQPKPAGMASTLVLSCRHTRACFE